MDTQKQARTLMIRHHKMIKNRQQSMLSRLASEIGKDIDSVDSCNQSHNNL
ncbi:hypothetical protein [Geminocystis sp.]|uniref:hypothetical protein n=1 Tax=Geminocystis sp. TaxID=2664100 RepID=UPI0035943AA8